MSNSELVRLKLNIATSDGDSTLPEVEKVTLPYRRQGLENS